MSTAPTRPLLGALLATQLAAQQFRPDALLPLPATSTVVLAENLDGDGDTDFVLAIGQSQSQSQVLENLGDGRFVPHPVQPVPVGTIYARGDFDGDGDVDFLASGMPLRLLRNDRTWLVDVTATNLLGTLPLPDLLYGLTDFDLDGDLDLVTTGWPVARLFLNSGGVLSEVVPSPLPAIPVYQQPQFADIDGDGHDDLLMLRLQGASLWMWRQGTYVDESAARLPVLTDECNSVAPFDADGDGDVDLVLVRRSPTRGVVLLANGGNGVFTDVTGQRLPATGPDFARVLPFDAEGDGDPDLLLSSNFATPALLRNDGAGNFAFDTGNWRGDFVGTAFLAIDLDGDPLADLWGSDGVFRSVPGRGLRHASMPQAALGLPADFDGDGDIDVLYRYLCRNEASRFEPENPSYPSEALAIGDVDGDGDVDAIFGVSFELSVWLNDGTGALARSLVLPAGLTLSGAALADVDGDGDLDLATAEGINVSGFQLQSRLLLNDGTGNFTDATATHLPSRLGGERRVLLADVDADGDLDLLYVPYLGTLPRYLENQGGGVFAVSPAQPAVVGGTLLAAAAFAQLDADPALELVLQTSTGFQLLDLAGGSWQNVTSTRIPGLPAGGYGFSLIDFDEDGDVDLLLQLQTDIRMFANDGSGLFTDVTAQRGAGLTHVGLAVDIDGDADLDLIAGSIQINQQRQLRPLLPPRTGRPWSLEFVAEPGYGTGSHVALVGLGFARLPHATVTPFGTFALGQPSVLAAAIVSNNGVAGTAALAVPADPALRGVQLWLQGIELALPSGNFHFTNLVKTAIE